MYQVAVLQFEGPLDLLLQLVEQSRLEVTTIALAEVTQQYLDHINRIERIQAEELNQFLELAVRLAHIKSLALLPELPSEADTAVEELSGQLAAYKQYKLAAARLEELLRQGRRSWTSRPQSLPAVSRPLPELDPQRLREAFRQLLAKLPPEPVSTPADRSVTLEDMTARLTGLRQPTPLSQLLERVQSRYEAIVLFLAILELLRQGKLGVSQDNQFDDMIITI